MLGRQVGQAVIPEGGGVVDGTLGETVDFHIQTGIDGPAGMTDEIPTVLATCEMQLDAVQPLNQIHASLIQNEGILLLIRICHICHIAYSFRVIHLQVSHHRG